MVSIGGRKKRFALWAMRKEDIQSTHDIIVVNPVRNSTEYSEYYLVCNFH
jgi:hypothetical protein